jgi:hypothetical protein
MLVNDDYYKYIKDKDYMMLTAKNGDVFQMEFNIDTYYNYGDYNNVVPHHIDMISRHLIPNSKWQMRTTYTNNGTSSIKNPYLASNEDGCVLKQLESYYSNNIPNVLKPYLLNKRYYAPTRYGGSSSTLTDDNGYEWVSLGMLWIPFEAEVFENTIYSNKCSLIGARRYPCFRDGKSIAKCETNSSNNLSDWHLANTPSGSTGGYSTFCAVFNYGFPTWHDAAFKYDRTPLCFRFK